MEPKTADFGASDVGATDVGASDVGATDFGATDVGATDVGATDFGATDVGATDFGASDVGATDFCATDFGAADFGASSAADHFGLETYGDHARTAAAAAGAAFGFDRSLLEPSWHQALTWKQCVTPFSPTTASVPAAACSDLLARYSFFPAASAVAAQTNPWPVFPARANFDSPTRLLRGMFCPRQLLFLASRLLCAGTCVQACLVGQCCGHSDLRTLWVFGGNSSPAWTASPLRSLHVALPLVKKHNTASKRPVACTKYCCVPRLCDRTGQVPHR